LKQPTSASMNVKMRVLFHLLDTNDLGYVNLVDGVNGAQLTSNLTGSNKGYVWTDWVQPSAGHAKVVFSYTTPCRVLVCNDLGCHEQDCSEGAESFAKFQAASSLSTQADGVVLEAYEYQRYQTGAQPFWTPLRFPGQYHDAETDLFENWNRYYDPSIGRYLQPEPLHQDPKWVRRVASMGFSPPVYSYAGNNPLARFDSNGLDAFIIRKPGSGLIEHWGVAVEVYCHSENTCDPERPVQRYDYSCSKVNTSATWQCVFGFPDGKFHDKSPKVTPLKDTLIPGNSVEVIPLSCEDSAAAVERVCGQLRSVPQYNILFNNCQQFVWTVVYGPFDPAAAYLVGP
jgi:RHS repeat-associated protein